MNRHIFLILLILSACSSYSDRDLLVIDYEQTFPDGTKKDLNIRIMSSVDVGFITAKDSLDYLFKVYNEKYYTRNADSLVALLKEWVTKYDRKIADFRNKIDSVNAIERDPQYSIDWEEIYTTAINDQSIVQQGHQEKLNDLLKYYSRKNEKLIKKVKYLFQLNNPDEKELVKIYLFNYDESRVVGSMWETGELI